VEGDVAGGPAPVVRDEDHVSPRGLQHSAVAPARSACEHASGFDVEAGAAHISDAEAEAAGDVEQEPAGAPA
jgi:hypothetical protein